ncbi:hypothetical protein [Corynebacterium pilosum]|uniref:Uncharacterized protein n=1 Tax=Corynebacterium pilosum TaxID=35756 RepID=A0A376CJ39_9CORY|nr:hypothetical protein [Corynebacterium pilosum]STC68444.1 Uncharacterised protein [Corynebacterium pilosum]
MGRSIVIKVIIAAALFVAYIVAAGLGVPNTITGPVFCIAIALVLFFPTKRQNPDTADKVETADNVVDSTP